MAILDSGCPSIPNREEPKSPLWVNLDWPIGGAMSYKNIRAMIQHTGKRAGIQKKFNPHMFKHRAVSKWILERFSDRLENIKNCLKNKRMAFSG